MLDFTAINNIDSLNKAVKDLTSVNLEISHKQIIELISKTDDKLATKLLADLTAQLELDKMLSNAVSHNYNSSDMFTTVYDTVLEVLTQSIDDNIVTINDADFESRLSDSVRKLDVNIERLISRYFSSENESVIELSAEQLKKYVASNNQRIFVFSHSLVENQRDTAMNTRFLRDMLVDSVYMNTHQLDDKKKNSIHNSLEYMRKVNILDQSVIDYFASSTSTSLRAETIINHTDCYEFLKAIEDNINNSAYEIESNERDLNLKVNISLTYNLNSSANSQEKSSSLYENQIAEMISK